MIINIDAFRKSFTDPTKENKANLIHRESEKLSGNKPIDLIASTNPITPIKTMAAIPLDSSHFLIDLLNSPPFYIVFPW